MSGRDLQHVGAMLGERARTGRASQHPREVKDANARKRTIAGRQWLGGTVANANDLSSGNAAMAAACGCFAHSLRPRHAAGALCSDDRLLEVGGVPGRNRARHRVAILRDA